MVTIQVRSRSIGTTQTPLPPVAFDLLNETLTIRELIAHAVEEQIHELQIQQKLDTQAVQHILNRQYLTNAEIQAQAKHGAVKMPEPLEVQTIDISRQIRKATEAFEKGVYVIVIDGEQAEALDQTVMLRPTSKITFLRLTPLVGG